MSRWLVIILSIAFISSSCTDSSTEPNKPVLTPLETSVTMAKGSYHWLTIKGGIGPIRVKSISDSSIVSNVIITLPWQYKGQPMNDVEFYGKKLGSTAITFIDSAGTATVTVPVTVTMMSFEHANVSVREGSTTSLFIQGGTAPFVIVGPPSDGIASYQMSGSFVTVTALSAGTTILTVRDSAAPSNSASVTITVTPKLVFTSPGKMSFTSNMGEFTADGIYVESGNGPVSGQGAGGFLQGEEGYFINCTIIAYRFSSPQSTDVVFLDFTRKDFGPASLAFGRTSQRIDSAQMVFFLGINPASSTMDMQYLTAGTMNVSAFTQSQAAGTFSGYGVMRKNGITGTVGSLTVSNGSFSVPLVLEDFGTAVPLSAHQQQVQELVRRNHLMEKVRDRFIRKGRQ